MSFSIHKFRDISELEVFLNGAIFGRSIVGVGQEFDLAGKTLTFTSPVAVVTFTAPAGKETLSYGDVKSQIETGNIHVKVCIVGGHLAIVEKTPTNGVAVADAAEPAQAILGIGRGATGALVLDQMSATPPRLENTYAMDGEHIAVVWNGN